MTVNESAIDVCVAVVGVKDGRVDGDRGECQGEDLEQGLWRHGAVCYVGGWTAQPRYERDRGSNERSVEAMDNVKGSQGEGCQRKRALFQRQQQRNATRLCFRQGRHLGQRSTRSTCPWPIPIPVT